MAKEVFGPMLPQVNVTLLGGAQSGRTTVAHAVGAFGEHRRGEGRSLGGDRRSKVRYARDWMPVATDRFRLWFEHDHPHEDTRRHLVERIRRGGHLGPNVGLLVVSAEDGAGLEALEQVRLAALLGLERFVICLTHADRRCDPAWADLVEADAREVLAEQGVPADEVPVVRGNFAAAYRDPRGKAARCAGELLDILSTTPTPVYGDKLPFRLAVEGVSAADGGAAVRGHVMRGVAQLGDAVELIGPGRTVMPSTVTAIEMFGRNLPTALVGGTVTLTLAGVEPSAVHGGDAVVTPGTAKPVSAFDAALVTADRPYGRLRVGMRLRVEALGTWFMTTVRGLWQLDGSRVAEIGPGECVRAACELERPMVLDAGDPLELADVYGFRPAAGMVRGGSVVRRP